MTSPMNTATLSPWIISSLVLFIAIIVCASSSSSSSTVLAFTIPTTTAIATAQEVVGGASRSLLLPSQLLLRRRHHHQQRHEQPRLRLVLPSSLLATSTSSSRNTANDDDDVVVVISPPGSGIGEMTAVEAARLGGTVKWFVVSAPTTTALQKATTDGSSSSAKSSSSSAAAAMKQVVSLAAETLAAIERAGGSLELAGASADSLLRVPDSSTAVSGKEEGSSRNRLSSSSLAAMASWCANSNCVISTYDDNGAASSSSSTITASAPSRMANNLDINNKSNKNTWMEGDETTKMIRAAIRLATKEAVLGMKIMTSQPPPTTALVASDGDDSGGGGNNKMRKNVMIAILPAGLEEEDSVTDKNNNNSNNTNNKEASSGSSGGLFGINLFGGKDKNDPVVPTTLMDAIGNTHGGGGGGSIVLRYGELFGAPESSPESSPFIGGPKRDPVVRDMYAMRSVRIDPTIISSTSSSPSSSSSSGITFKSNRLAVAEAASRLGMGMLDTIVGDYISTTSLDVTLSSFAGTERPSNEEWNAEFGRVVSEFLSSPSSVFGGIGVGGAQQRRRLFRAEFASVPSTKRLAEWIATKWAPAVLRSYDIAGIRVGARPVYALLQSSASTTPSANVNVVEIVWQELVNFNSVTSGKMIIEVGDSGMMAWRGAGDATKGFGSISSSPLPGEDILVRRLADAATQAIEKGLAIKPLSAKKAVVVLPKEPVTTVVVDKIADTVPAPLNEPVSVSTLSSSDGPGPRSAGARRSSERSRGSRKEPPVPSPTQPIQVTDGEGP